mgnify:CR=1 FL=1
MTLKRILVAAWRSFRRNGWLSTATILVMAEPLFVIGGLLLLSVVTNAVLTQLEQRIDISVEFNQGTNITTIDKTSHFTAWNLQTNFYVKCRDIYGNQPNPDRCSITIRPSKLL